MLILHARFRSWAHDPYRIKRGGIRSRRNMTSRTQPSTRQATNLWSMEWLRRADPKTFLQIIGSPWRGHLSSAIFNCTVLVMATAWKTRSCLKTIWKIFPVEMMNDHGHAPRPCPCLQLCWVFIRELSDYAFSTLPPKGSSGRLRHKMKGSLYSTQDTKTQEHRKWTEKACQPRWYTTCWCYQWPLAHVSGVSPPTHMQLHVSAVLHMWMLCCTWERCLLNHFFSKHFHHKWQTSWYTPPMRDYR